MEGILSALGSIIEWARNIAVLIAVLMLIYHGIRHMQGEELSKSARKGILGVAIGVLVVFSASQLVTWVQGLI